jgi:nitroreductase
MDAITALHSRASSVRLREPAPEGVVREQIFRAALRAPDHARLQPWRFLVVEGEARRALGELLVESMRQHLGEIDEQAAAKLRANPLRAPLLLVLVARTTGHPKVPELEQLLSVACAAQNMLLAAHALGFAGIWRTGPVTYTAALHRALGLAESERLLGFLYLGTADGPARSVQEPALAAHFETWSGT